MDYKTLNSHPKSSPPPPQFDHHNRLQSMSSPIRTIAETPNWLRRLRASKGFPDTDDTDLESFLSRSYKKIDPKTCTDLALTDKRPDLDKCDDSDAMHGCDNVLPELFYMENTRKILTNSDKISWSLPLTWTVKRRRTVKKVTRELKTALLPLTWTMKHKSTVREVNQELKSGERVEVEEKCDLDLSWSSKTEVTIIDTSVPSRKFEKMFRRKNVWEVGDKKGKALMSGDRLKRNKSLNDNGDVQKKKFQLCSLSKSRAAAERGDKKKKRLQLCNSSESAHAQGHEQGKAVVSASEKKQDSCSQAPEKSVLKKQIDGGSSVILIKSIPTTNKKDVSGVSKSYVKSMEK